jgi:3-deoxy-D-manno-octulosonate 8-phosphate phosphatase (KDO 8-P phosphatase)
MQQPPDGQVSLIVFDFDGVLTDNRVIVLEDGREAVFCNRADGLAFDILRNAGVPVLIMTTERNQLAAARARKLRVPILRAVADKGVAIDVICRERGVDPTHVMFVGNDVNDLPAMSRVGHPVAVADANPAVKAAATIVLRTCGGDGVAREVANLVLASKKVDTE